MVCMEIQFHFGTLSPLDESLNYFGRSILEYLKLKHNCSKYISNTFECSIYNDMLPVMDAGF